MKSHKQGGPEHWDWDSLQAGTSELDTGGPGPSETCMCVLGGVCMCTCVCVHAPICECILLEVS